MGGLDAVHAADAYAFGYNGTGVTIGIVDFNFVLGSPEINYAAGSVGVDAHSRALYEAQIGQSAPTDQHGQAVAAVAAALKNDSGIHGIAYGAQVLAVDYFSNVNPYTVTQNGVLIHVSDPWTYLTSHGARVVSLSLGYEASDVISNPPVVTEAYVVDTAAIAVVNGALLVSSAGNAAGANPSKSNLDIIDDIAAAQVPASGPGAFIIAGGVDANNQIASFSDRAGTAKNYYLVAPAVGLVFPWNGSLYTGSGTSFSAPLIAGAAAIVFQRWPNLTAREVADILFQSATDLGAPGVDAVYGHGLLNVYAALQPMGMSTLAVANGPMPALANSAMMLSPAFGDAPQFKAALKSVMILDGFDRDFEVDLSHAVVARANLPGIFDVMEQKFRWHMASFPIGTNARFDFDMRENSDDALLAVRHLNGAEDTLSHQTVFQFSGATSMMIWSAGSGLSLRDALAPRDAGDPFGAASLTGAFYPLVGGNGGAFATLHFDLGVNTGLAFGIAEEDIRGPNGSALAHESRSHAAALRLSHDAGAVRLGVELGTDMADGGALGSFAEGGFNMARAATGWASVQADADLGAYWSLRGLLTVTASGAQHPESSLIASVGPIYATSFSLGLARRDVFDAGDSLAFVVGQPLRAERATLTLLSGHGRDRSNNALLMSATQTSLTPSGREMDIESAYRFALGEWSAEADVAYSFDANHVRGENAVAALIWLSRKF
jgi:hypothetical protein